MYFMCMVRNFIHALPVLCLLVPAMQAEPNVHMGATASLMPMKDACLFYVYN